MFHEMNMYAKTCILMQNKNRVNWCISVTYGGGYNQDKPV